MSTSNTLIQVKKSGISGNTPVDLNTGELALNYADGKLFYKDTNDTISSIENQNTFSTIVVDSTYVVSNSTHDVITFVSGDNINLSTDTISKTITINSSGGEQKGNLLTSSTISNQILDSYDGSVYRTTKYVIQALSGTQIHCCEVILSHNDIKTSLSQYGIVKSTRFNLFTLDSDIVTGNVILYITPVNNDTQIDFIRTSIISRSLPV